MSMNENNENKWTGYMAIVSIVICFLIIQDVLEENFLPIGPIVISTIGVLPVIVHLKMSAKKPDSFKKRLFFILTGIMFGIMIISVLILKN